MSDISQVFEMDYIFTRKDTISGLKSSLWSGLIKLVNTPLDSSIFAGRYHNLQYCFPGSIYIAEYQNKFKPKLSAFLRQHSSCVPLSGIF